MSVASLVEGRTTTLLGVGGSVCAVLCTIIALQLRLQRTRHAVTPDVAHYRRVFLESRCDRMLEGLTGLGLLVGQGAATLEHGDLFLRQFGWSIVAFSFVACGLCLYMYGLARWTAARQGQWVA